MNSINPITYKKILMVEPTYFDVEYAINPFMKDFQGHLQKIDRDKAQTQWENLRAAFATKGALQVECLPGQPKLPDMVFSANQSFPFIHPKTLRPSVVLSHMRSHFRQPEVEHFKSWFQLNGYDVYDLESPGAFESNGDIIPHPGENFFWGGFGARTDRAVYQELSHRFGLIIEPLELIHPDFYHLDTCFVVLNNTTCGLIEEAVSPESLIKIQKKIPNILRISVSEGRDYFAGNAFCPDGKNIFLQRGTTGFKNELLKRDFVLHEVDTSEFMKSGGSVFCMKLALPL